MKYAVAAALSLVVGLSAVPTAAAVSGDRAATIQYRLTAVAGNASYLVYEKFGFGDDGRVNPGLRLFTLTGGVLTDTKKHCQGSVFAPVTLGESAVWLGCPSDTRIWQIAANGKISGSSRTFAPVQPVAALHEIILSPRGRADLIGLTSATAKPRVIVPAN